MSFQPSVCLRMVNQQQGSGLFEVALPIFEGDVVAKIAARLMKTERSKIKGKVSLRRRVLLRLLWFSQSAGQK